MRNLLSYNFFSAFFIILIAAAVSRKTVLIYILSALVAFLAYFYRYTHKKIVPVPNSYVISPSEGTIMAAEKKGDVYYIAIFLSPLDKHYQLYPCNCFTAERLYDATGKYEIAMNITKSKYNEKMIHLLQMSNGAIVKLTQIAGFLPRRITSEKSLYKQRYAGEYLGMIEFGSRVDLEIPAGGFNMIIGKKNIGKRIGYGDTIGYYS